MGPWDIFFGLWLTATLLLSLTSLAARGDGTVDRDPLTCAGMLALSWTITGYMIARYNPPWSFAANPILDLAAGIVAMWLYLRTPVSWKLVLAFIYVGQLIGHAAYFAALAWGQNDPETYYRYQLLLSILFACQLLCVSVPGGRDVVAWLRPRLPRRPGPVHNHPARAKGPRP